MSNLPEYKLHTIWRGGPIERTFTVVGDVNNDGQDEIIIGSRRPFPMVACYTRQGDNSWQVSVIDEGFAALEAGGYLHDVNGNGYLDLIAGEDGSGRYLYWWENPGPKAEPGRKWKRRFICEMPGRQSHDQIVADLDGDGKPELYFWNQGSQNLFMVPIPDDPTVAPWRGIRSIASGMREEGFAIADVDGDGKPELIAGQSWYRYTAEGEFERHEFCEGYVSTRLAAADFDGDGKIEIAVSEGDASLYAKRLGRAAVFHQKDDPTEMWDVQVLHDKLIDPHSIAVADFDGDGSPDLYVGEMNMPVGGDPHLPKQRIFLSRGDQFEEHVIGDQIGAHEAKLITVDGKIGIVNKPFLCVRYDLPRPADVDAIHIWLPED